MSFEELSEILRPLFSNPKGTITAIALLALTTFAFFFFAWREFLSWYLKTQHILDEVVRIRTEIATLNHTLSASNKNTQQLHAENSAASNQATSQISLTPAIPAALTQSLSSPSPTPLPVQQKIPDLI